MKTAEWNELYEECETLFAKVVLDLRDIYSEKGRVFLDGSYSYRHHLNRFRQLCLKMEELIDQLETKGRDLELFEDVGELNKSIRVYNVELETLENT